MQIGLLIIASEVLDGKISDKNTHYFSRFLRRNFLRLSRVLTVSDQVEDIQAGLEYLYKNCQFVVTSGGLGPTPDDLTKEAIAGYFQKAVVPSETALVIAEENYQRRGRPFPGEGHGYSYLPEAFLPLSNSTGFAPGFFFGEDHRRIILSVPGVPREFQSMCEDHFMSLIDPLLGARPFLDYVVFRTKGIPEEKIFGEVDPELWNKLSHFGEVASLPVLFGVDVVVKLSAVTAEELSVNRSKLLAEVSASPVAPNVWHVGAESVEELIVARATEKKLTIGFAESATGGLCSHRITSVPGSSRVFTGSVVSYADSVKINDLGVDKKTITSKGVVSTQTAEEMAQGLAEKLRVTIAVSVTGLAGPGGGGPDTPVGSVCIGTCVNGRIRSQRYQFQGDREQLKERFCHMALMTLWEELEKIA